MPGIKMGTKIKKNVKNLLIRGQHSWRAPSCSPAAAGFAPEGRENEERVHLDYVHAGSIYSSGRLLGYVALSFSIPSLQKLLERLGVTGNDSSELRVLTRRSPVRVRDQRKWAR